MVYLGLAVRHGKHLMIDTTTISLLGKKHEFHAIKVWNASP
jgi:hypothetical protein